MDITETLTEEEVRALRDAIFGPSKDDNWKACKENWMKPHAIKWLIDENKKEQHNG